MVTVEADVDQVERRLAAGELSCPSCGGVLAGWRVVELDVSYGPRTGGKSKVSGSLRGSIIAILDFWKVIS